MFTVQGTITTQNKLAVRDGFVEIPDAMRFRQTLTVADVLALIPGSRVTKETFSWSNEGNGALQYMSSTFPALGDGPSVTDELWILLPANTDNANPTPTDWYQVLRTAAAAKVVV